MKDILLKHKIAIIVCIVMVFITFVITKVSIYSSMIQGFWDVTDSFCKRSGMSCGSVYFDNGAAYFILQAPDGNIINKCVNYSISPTLCNWFAESLTFGLSFEENIYPIPETVDFRLSVKNGNAGMFVDDTLYLELVKNAAATCGV